MLLPGSQIRRLREEAPSNFATLLYKVVNNHHDGIVYSFERGWSWCFFANLFYKDVPDHDDNVEVDVKCGTFLSHPDYLPPYSTTCSTRLNEDGDDEHIQL